MEQDQMKGKNTPVKPREFLVARGPSVLGTYTTRRIAVAVAEEKKAMVYRIAEMGSMADDSGDRMLVLTPDRSFEEAL